MARAQTLKKKGRSSSSAKRNRGQSVKSRTAGRRRRPTARGMVGSKGKGRNAERRGTAGGRTSGGGGGDGGARTRGRVRGTGDRSREITGDDTGIRPEGSMPPTLVSGDATVAEQRRAASRQPGGARTDRPPRQARGKPGARGGSPTDRQRRARRGDALETGREDLTEPTLESTRGARPRGGDEGRRARARRATPRGDSRSAGTDRRRSAKLYERSPSR